MIRVLRVLEYTYDSAETMLADRDRWVIQKNKITEKITIRSAVVSTTVEADRELSRSERTLDKDMYRISRLKVGPVYSARDLMRAWECPLWSQAKGTRDRTLRSGELVRVDGGYRRAY